jgi:hypothetical protein
MKYLSQASLALLLCAGAQALISDSDFNDDVSRRIDLDLDEVVEITTEIKFRTE